MRGRWGRPGGCVCLLAMLLLQTGCAGSRVAVLPGHGPEGGPEGGPDAPAPHVLKAGEQAEILLLDGTRFRGEVKSVSSAGLTLAWVGNHGYQEEVLAATAIEQVTQIMTGSIWPWAIGAIVLGIGWASHQMAHFD